MRLLAPALALLALLTLTACSAGEPSTIASTREPASSAITPTPGAHPMIQLAASSVVVTPAPAAIPIYHAPPYTVAIEAGHGGPKWFGAVGYDADGNRLIEKDLALDTALRLDQLLREAGFQTLLIRDSDFTLTPFDSADYRPNMIAETQARVDVVNEARADVLVSVHFNGSVYSALRGTETYYNPARSAPRASRWLRSYRASC